MWNFAVQSLHFKGSLTAFRLMKFSRCSSSMRFSWLFLLLSVLLVFLFLELDEERLKFLDVSLFSLSTNFFGMASDLKMLKVSNFDIVENNYYPLLEVRFGVSMRPSMKIRGSKTCLFSSRI